MHHGAFLAAVIERQWLDLLSSRANTLLHIDFTHQGPVTKRTTRHRTTVTLELLPLTKRSCTVRSETAGTTHASARARNPYHRLGSRRVRVRKSDFVKCSAISAYICGARAPGRHIHTHIRSSYRPSPAISRHLPVFDVVLVSLSFVKYWRGGSWLSCGSHVHGGSASVSVRRNGTPSRASSLRPPSWRGA